MPILTALIHLAAFGAIVVGFEAPAARLLLAVIAVPVLALHVLVWAMVRFLRPRVAVGATVLFNAMWPAAGWLFWLARTGGGTTPPDVAGRNAVTFFVIGLATSALLVTWVRFVSRRGRSASS